MIRCDQRNTCHSEFLSKPHFWLEMICPVCARSICPMVRADTGGTCDASAPDTGSPASIWKLEEDFSNQARRGRRVQSGGHRFELRRINALSGSRSGPFTISSIAAVWRQPIAVANTFCCQACIFVQGRALLPIWTKTMEIRGVAFKKGRYFLGFRKNVYGWIEFGDPARIADQKQWVALRHRHCVPTQELPYNKNIWLPDSASATSE